MVLENFITLTEFLGVAYAMLAKVDAVSGLYVSFFPSLIYMLLGTSKHNSIGSFAIVGLMTGLAVDRLTKMEFRLVCLV